MLTDLILYDLKVAALIAVFYLFYMLLLSRETMHKLNRVVLLLGIVLSAVLPFCVITLHKTVVVEETLTTAAEEAVTDTTLPATEALEHSIDWTIPLVAVLLIGTIVRLLFLWQSYRQLKRLVRSGEIHTMPTGTKVCVVEEAVAPFSWMKTVVMSRSDWNNDVALPTILAHEEAHVRHRHSYDVVVVELLTALQWFNPVVWFMRQELRILHEYEADADVLSYGFNESQYIHLLMQKAMGIQACVLANGIHTPKTKKRIIMMLKNKSNRHAWLRALYVVPVVLVSLAVSAKTLIHYETAPMPEMQASENSASDEKQEPIIVVDGKIVDIPIQLKEKTSIEDADFLRAINIKSKEDIESVVVLQSKSAVELYGEKGKNGVIEIKTKKKEIPMAGAEDDKVFEKCEVTPRYAEGEGALMQFIAQNIRYPKEAAEHGIQGRVVVKFIVNKDGLCSNFKILNDPAKFVKEQISQENGVDVVSQKQGKDVESSQEEVMRLSKSLETEAIRVLKLMGKWEPGKQRGMAVRAYYVLPITFRLQ